MWAQTRICTSSNYVLVPTGSPMSPLNLACVLWRWMLLICNKRLVSLILDGELANRCFNRLILQCKSPCTFGMPINLVMELLYRSAIYLRFNTQDTMTYSRRAAGLQLCKAAEGWSREASRGWGPRAPSGSGCHVGARGVPEWDQEVANH